MLLLLSSGPKKTHVQLGRSRNDKTTLDDVEITFQNLKQNKLIYFDDIWYLFNNDDLDENIFKSQVSTLELSISKSIKNNNEYKTFLVIASCLGYQFDLKVLSNATGLNLIETAQKIEEISFKTGIFENLPNPYNKIKFRNRATLNALINVFGILSKKPAKTIKSGLICIIFRKRD